MKNTIISRLAPGKNSLCLGTVQFGLDYGINNPNGKPSRQRSLEMLDYAYKRGIRFFDTAAAYGDAEEILGEFIRTRKPEDEIFITSKLLPNIISENEKNVYKIIEKELKKTLNKLGVKKLYGYYFHTPGYIYNKEIVSALKKCKKDGLVSNIGVSIYEEKDALFAAKMPVDIIQIPYSIFDQRLNNKDFFEIAKKNKIKVFARSAFLQGLIFMSEEKIPLQLERAKVYLREFDEIIGKYNLSRQKAALLFSYKNKNIDHVVFGVDNIDQLKEDIDTVEENIDFKKCLDELKNKFINIEKYIIFPSLWKK